MNGLAHDTRDQRDRLTSISRCNEICVLICFVLYGSQNGEWSLNVPAGGKTGFGLSAGLCTLVVVIGVF